LMSLHVKHVPTGEHKKMKDELKGGLQYVQHHGSLVALIVLAATTTFLAFASSRVLWLSSLLLFFTGGALMMVFSTVTSLVQLIAPDNMRGRVMSIYMVAFRGGMPLGSLA